MFSVIGKLGWYFKLEWRRYLIAVSLLTLVGFIEVIPPKLLGYAIDGISQGSLSDRSFYLIIGSLIVITLAGYFITYVWMSQLFGGANVLQKLLRGKLMSQFLRMTPTFYERNRTGDLMARSTNDLSAISMTAGFGILTLVDSTLFMLTILLVMVFLISWKLTLAALLPLPFIALVMGVFGRKIHERFMKAQNSFGELNDEVLESVSGVRVIRAYVQEGEDRKRFHAKTNEVLERNIEVARIDALFEPVNKILVGLSYIIGLVYGGVLVFRNEITLGDLISFNIFLGMLIWPMFAIGELINIMQRGNASLDRVEETLSVPADVEDGDNLVEKASPGEIVFNSVTFRYPSSQEDNLREVSFRLAKGGTLGVVGRTGSGKTTLLKQLIREYPAGQGELLIGGLSIERIGLDRLHSWFGYVPQAADSVLPHDP